MHKTKNQARNRRGWGASGYKGVYWRKSRGFWFALITVNDNKKYLGSFPDPELAAAAYDEAAMTYFGNHALLNGGNHA